MSQFIERELDVTFQLGMGEFGEGGFNTAKITGLPVSASVVRDGGVAMGALQLTIDGLRRDTMRKLATLGQRRMDLRNNKILVEAGGSSSAARHIVFSGEIQEAEYNLDAQPESPFSVKAYAGLGAGIKPIPPASFRGMADVATILAGVAASSGLSFQNYGVTAQITDQYLPGTGREQIEALRRSGLFDSEIHDNTLFIWPVGGSRGGDVPVISAATNMVGYPRFSQAGIDTTCIYEPTIHIGTRVRIESDVDEATGEWIVFRLAHALQSRIPGGPWYTYCQTYDPALGGPPATG